ncbi:cytochrome d ubiquinol oxidase subunit II [Vibrio sp. SM6]|uniref:Cytochrome d ubiquinol oxidase subunit II n=1 Tax=Vibrio agarilyticus TaxID=2726741 RepID=A0A7X8TNN8_9VIBR|nr:cytochrome d ubiquinol oxidase subunit II [Vibrio agarilyticus]NLS12095.1 cytochrome d ubiquinol oxidase subunit II [Vibrio agarilyticus]
MDYALIWYALIALAVLIYVILDGFDLGIGLLFLRANSEAERDLMMNSIAPVWDGNETWLVLGGGGLFAVFPLAYSIIMPAFYAPVIVMLLGLILRGVSFEYRFRTKRGRFLWDSAFFLGSLLATVMQGIMLGALIQGLTVTDRAYAGEWFDWLSPFSLFTGFALISAYILLGACWLIIKLPNDLISDYYTIAKRWGIVLVIAIIVTSLWLPLANDTVFARWFHMPNALFFFVVPLAAIGFIWLLFSSLLQHRPIKAYLCAIGLFVVSAAGFGVSTFPYLVPFAVTYKEAAGPDESLTFLLVGTVILLPLILLYTGYSYWVFRGKLKHGDGYH